MTPDYSWVLVLLCVAPVLWAAIWFAIGRWSKGIRISRITDTSDIADTRYRRADQSPRPLKRVRPTFPTSRDGDTGT